MASLSAPPTPSPELPRQPQDWRFQDKGYPCEWAEEYRPGGLHPISFGNKLKNDQYRIIRKLGNGSFSTVWLAVNSQEPKYVAIKVMAAKYSLPGTASPEIELAAALSPSNNNPSPGVEHVLKLQEFFQHVGPNGAHTCLVYEPMGGTVASMLEKLYPRRRRGERPRYPKWMAKRILKHTLLGLAYLHSNNIVHGDLQHGNLLFAPRNLEHVDEADLRQDVEETTYPLVRLDGKQDKWAPSYLALDQPLDQYANLGDTMSVKISDLGAGFFKDKPPAKVVTPVALRAPEIIVNQPVNEKIDIWSLGCLIYELITGTRLFAVDMMALDTEEETDDDHLRDLNDILGDLPNNIMAVWSRSHLYFGPKRERLNPGEKIRRNLGAASVNDGEAGREGSGGVNDRGLDHYPEHPSEPDAEAELFINKPLEALFDENKPADIGPEEAQTITSLIRRILKYDPSERPAAEDLLAEEWFQDC